MPKISVIFLLTSLLLAACAPGPTVTSSSAESPAPVLSPTVERPTSTPTSTSAPEILILETSTPTVTPLPTIATFTPTFDARTIVTATPAPKVECPKENREIKPTFLDQCKTANCEEPLQLSILDYLNAGGMVRKLEKALSERGIVYEGGSRYRGVNDSLLQLIDLTGDQVSEVVFVHALWEGLSVYSCDQGSYRVLFALTPIKFAPYMAIKDLNGNGVPEIILDEPDTGGTSILSIYEYNGEDFISLLKVPMDDGVLTDQFSTINHVSSISFADSNESGVFEIVIEQGKPVKEEYVAAGLPWRNETIVITWTGINFMITKREYARPQYHFQMMQDADQQLITGNNQKAIDLYQNVIFHKELEWWSPERKSYEYEKYFSGNDPNQATLLPAPNEDSTEYPRLVAYAYYRMVILHTYLGEIEAAQTQYATLQEKFPTANPGHPYAEMATGFWNAYQSSGKIYPACAAAIAYADVHPEILTPLGSAYHGAQSYIYVPADVCPLR